MVRQNSFSRLIASIVCMFNLIRPASIILAIAFVLSTSSAEGAPIMGGTGLPADPPKQIFNLSKSVNTLSGLSYYYNVATFDNKTTGGSLTITTPYAVDSRWYSLEFYDEYVWKWIDGQDVYEKTGRKKFNFSVQVNGFTADIPRPVQSWYSSDSFSEGGLSELTWINVSSDWTPNPNEVRTSLSAGFELNPAQVESADFYFNKYSSDWDGIIRERYFASIQITGVVTITSVPEPASLSFLAIGSIFLGRRRRKC